MTKQSRGKCPICGYSERLTKDGRIMAHTIWYNNMPFRCDGSKAIPIKTSPQSANLDPGEAVGVWCL